MIAPFFLTVLLAAVPSADDPPVHVWLNSDATYSRGDRARVYLRAAQDGYAVVLHADPDGRVRVLFPRDPGDDAFVRGDRKIEVRGRSDREAFVVDEGDRERGGRGTVVAAWSARPFQFDAFTRNGHWDYRVLAGDAVRDDAEVALLDFVRRMAGEERFEYDVVTYVVGVAGRYRRPFYSPYGSSFRLSLLFGSPYRYGFGYRYYPWYDPFYAPFYYYDPYCYDPFWGYDRFCGRVWPTLDWGGYYWPRYRSVFVVTRRPSVEPFVLRNDRDRAPGIEPRPRAPVTAPATDRRRDEAFPVRPRSSGGGARGGEARERPRSRDRGPEARPRASSRPTSRPAPVRERPARTSNGRGGARAGRRP